MYTCFSRKKFETTLLLVKSLMLILFLMVGQSLSAQIKYEIELLPDNETYLISFVPEVTYYAPNNIVVSGQVTIRLPHGVAPNSFEVTDLTMETPGATWESTDIVYAPVEAPSFDYFSFALTTPGTPAYTFDAGVPVPVFSFKNGAGHCADSLYIIDNFVDPFLPPNSLGLNVGNSLVIFGGGFSNIYGGAVGTGTAPGSPETICVNEMLDEYISCDTVFYEGEAYTRDTVFDIHYTSSMGCDSVFVTRITIQDQITSTVDTTICEGDIFKGVEILQDEVVTEDFITSHGCDSIVTYLIKVVGSSSFSENIDIQAGDLVNGIAVFSDTIIIENLTNADGCDSTYTINVSVFNDQPTIIDIDLCLGEIYNGQFFLEDTTLTEVLTNTAGMDSTVLTNVSVHETFYVTILNDLCEGEPAANGVVYSGDTVIVENYQTVYGCDSVITTTVLVTIPEQNIVDTAICYGELYQGVFYYEDEVFTESILSANGCDSIVNQVNLTVHPDVEAAIDGVTEICKGDETMLTASGGTDFLWADGSTSNQLLATGPGAFNVTVSVGGECSETASVTVVESGLSANTAISHPQCNSAQYGTINITDVNGGFEPYIYSIDGGDNFMTEPFFPDLDAGEYAVVIEDQFGCSFEEMVEIDAATDIWVDAGDDQTIRLGEMVDLRAETNLPAPDLVIWSPTIGLDCPDCLHTEASPLVTTVYTVTVFDEDGCSAESQVVVKVKSDKLVYVPNAFSPNGDGFNDEFTVFTGDNVTSVLRFAVFERWGGHVFSTQNINPNDLTAGWNGIWRNEPAPEGIYIWMAEVEFLDGKKELFEGEVTLMR